MSVEKEPVLTPPQETHPLPQSPLTTSEIGKKLLGVYAESQKPKPQSDMQEIDIWAEEGEDYTHGSGDVDLHPQIDTDNTGGEGENSGMDDFDHEITFEEDTT